MKRYFLNLYLALMNKTMKYEVVNHTVKVEVLSNSAYSRLQRKLEQPILSGSDTSHNAAYKLGIQRSLSVVRDEFAVLD